MKSLKLLGITQKELAKMLQTSEPQITRIKQGKKDLTVAELEIIKKELNPSQTTINEIIKEATENKKPKRTRKTKSRF